MDGDRFVLVPRKGTSAIERRRCGRHHQGAVRALRHVEPDPFRPSKLRKRAEELERQAGAEERQRQGGADEGRAPPARPRQGVGVALAAPFPRAAFPHSLPTGSTPRCQAWQRSALVALVSVSGDAARVGRVA
jgi:hypothetical protein